MLHGALTPPCGNSRYSVFCRFQFQPKLLLHGRERDRLRRNRLRGQRPSQVAAEAPQQGERDEELQRCG